MDKNLIEYVFEESNQNKENCFNFYEIEIVKRRVNEMAKMNPITPKQILRIRHQKVRHSDKKYWPKY